MSAERATTDPRATPLRRDNAMAAVIHIAQTAAVVALASDFALPVTASYLAGLPGTTPQDVETLFDIPTGAPVAAFLALSALAQFLVSTAWWKRYVADLGPGINRARWVEYSISSSLMIVLIAQLLGIYDIAALLGLFGVNASMILFGWLQERYEQPRSGGWLPCDHCSSPFRGAFGEPLHRSTTWTRPSPTAGLSAGCAAMGRP